MTDRVLYFIDANVPVFSCNFECAYCYVNKNNKPNRSYASLPYPLTHVAKALSRERFGGRCAINLCGSGETLLHPDVVPLVILLLQEGHYLSIVTNATIQREMDQLLDLPPELTGQLFIKFSFHYVELQRLGLLARFSENVKRAKAAGISFTVELVAAECNIALIDDIKAFSMEHFGAMCHVTDARDTTKAGLPRKTTSSLSAHQALWGQFDSSLFAYRQVTWGQNRTSDFCYSGAFCFTLALENGALRQCYKGMTQNIFDDIDEPIHFFATGRNCPFPHCFNSHVWDCFVGVIPGIKSPSYADIRNRVCADGSEWLTPTYKALYGSRLCSLHDEYDMQRKLFTDGIMALMLGQKELDSRLSEIVDSYLNKAGFSTVAIFGESNIARWLLANIKRAVPFHEGVVQDAVIIADYNRVVLTKRELRKLTDLPLVNVVDIPCLAIK